MRPKFALSPLQYGWKPLLSALVMLLAGLSLTAYSLHLTQHGMLNAAQKTFNQYVDRLENAIQTQFNQPLYGVQGAIGAQASAGVMRRANFRAYVASRDLATEFPGIRGFAYIERVQRSDLKRFEQAEQADGAANFKVNTQGNAADMYIVKYMEPLANNQAIFGLDLGTNAVFREAIERAINTGHPSLSGVGPMIQDEHKGPGFMYLVPVFTDGETPDSPQARHKALTGFFGTPLLAAELLSGFFQVTHGDIDFEVFDGITSTPQSLVFSSQKTMSNHMGTLNPTDFKTERLLYESRNLVVGERLLTLRVGSSAIFEAELDHTTPLWVGAGGATLSLLLAAIVWLLLIGRARAETLASAMTQDLDQLVHTQTADNAKLSKAMSENHALTESIDQHAMVSIANPTGTITYVNDMFCQVSGYSREELMGQNHRILKSDAQSDAFWADMWQAISTGKVWRDVICNRAKDGALYWVNTVISPFFDDNGIEKFIAIRTDITATKLAQQALATERERLSNIITATRAGTWEWNVQTDALVVNARWADIIGYALPELNPVTAATWIQHTHPDDLAKAEALIAEHIESGLGYYGCEIRMRHRDGHWVWIQDRGKVTSWTADGKPEWMSGTHMDISLRINAAAEAARTTAMLQSVLDASSEVAFITTGLDRTITLFNTGAERMLGYAAAEVVGLHDTTLFLDPQELAQRSAKIAIESDHTVSATDVVIDESMLGKKTEWTYIRKDGSKLMVSQVVTPLTDANGVRSGYLGISHDISAEKDYENGLHTAMQEAQAATLSKSQFLANMSHEIRTPMNAILGMLKLLQNTELTPRQLDYASKTEGAAQSLLGLLNNILDFSKLDADKMELYLQPFRVDRLLRDLSVIVTANVGDKPVKVLFDVDPATPKALVGDAMRLQQVLINLSGNAIKFTAQGEVLIQIRVLARRGADTTLRFSVRDSGIGIALENQKHIFDGFSQAEASTTRRFGGTGLGLSISRQLVALMGGELTLDSVLGQGSTFHFTLTLPASEQIPVDPDMVVKAKADKQRRLQGMRLLVVEDNLINQQVAKELLRNEGALIEIAANGQLGVDAVATADPPFDAVLMDIQMPVMDGYTATRFIRQEMGLRDLPIIAMTANAMTSDREACLAAGMNEHVGKPFNLPSLVTLLLNITRAASRTPEARPSSTPLFRPAPVVLPVAQEVDVEDALERLGGDTALYARILQAYLSEIAGLPDQLDSLLREDDIAGASRLLHTLKGLSATVGASYLAEVAKSAESKLKGVKSDLQHDALRMDFRAAVAATCTRMGHIAHSFTPAVQEEAPLFKKSALEVPSITSLLEVTRGKPKLLVVDDQPINLQVMQQIFATDFQVDIATSGAQALTLCKDQPPDLVLLDIVMPGMDGFEVCTQLKADELTRNIPVIFVTAYTDAEQETKGLAVGAVDFISKPVNPAVVRARVTTQLTLKFQSDLMRKLVFLDGLTGVFNRRYFDQQLDMEMARSVRNQSPLALLMLDVDFFKRYNDHYGHQAGDDCLRQIALVIKEGLRRPADLVARYGGEEFGCILPETSFDDAMLIANELEQRVRALLIPHVQSDAAQVVTISLGVAGREGDTPGDASTLLAQADAQLYKAKYAGRAKVCGHLMMAA